ncbi:MAG: dUTP diphosphatase [Dehalococcoidia bacterium]|nr:dUTP diphosphatase [Dehalococcoidia bacterium]
MKVKRLHPLARLPERATPGSSGCDLYACTETEIEVGRDPTLIPTGIAIEAPAGFDVQIRPRSGLSARGVMGTFGTIDSDYRGELMVTLYCVGNLSSYIVRDGDRIAQLVVAVLASFDLREVTDLSDSARGAGGHGSTGP